MRDFFLNTQIQLVPHTNHFLISYNVTTIIKTCKLFGFFWTRNKNFHSQMEQCWLWWWSSHPTSPNYFTSSKQFCHQGKISTSKSLLDDVSEPAWVSEKLHWDQVWDYFYSLRMLYMEINWLLNLHLEEVLWDSELFVHSGSYAVADEWLILPDTLSAQYPAICSLGPQHKGILLLLPAQAKSWSRKWRFLSFCVLRKPNILFKIFDSDLQFKRTGNKGSLPLLAPLLFFASELHLIYLS